MGVASSHVKHLLQGGAALEELQRTFKQLDKDHDGFLSLKELESVRRAVGVVSFSLSRGQLTLAVFKVLKADPKMADVHVPYTGHSFSAWNPHERFHSRFPVPHGGELVSTHVARALQQLMGGHDEPITVAQFLAFDWSHVVDKLEEAAAAEQAQAEQLEAQRQQEAAAAAARAAEERRVAEAQRRAREAAEAEVRRQAELLRRQQEAEAQQRVRDARQYQSAAIKERFEQFCRQNELAFTVENQIFEVLSNTEVVLLCDDSGSMKTTIQEQGKPPIARWQELKRLAATCIDVVTSVNPSGLDIYFMNRPTVKGVTNTAGLQAVFDQPPGGGTPLMTTLRRIYKDKADAGRQTLIVVISDGEPSDGDHRDFFNCLMAKPNNFHVSIAECTDDERDMEYLDKFDGRIPNFDNTDDYREELSRVRAAQGATFKFDYFDYVLKILLASFLRWYFLLDGAGGNNNQNLIGVYPTECDDDDD